MSRPLPHFSPGQALSARALQGVSNYLREKDRYAHVSSPSRGGHGRRGRAASPMPFDCALATKPAAPPKEGEEAAKPEFFLTVRAGAVTLDAGGYAEIPEKSLDAPNPVKVEAAGFVWLTVRRDAKGKLTYRYEIKPERPGLPLEVKEDAKPT